MDSGECTDNGAKTLMSESKTRPRDVLRKKPKKFFPHYNNIGL